MSIFSNISSQKKCFVACHPDIIKSGGCSCHRLPGFKNLKWPNRISKLKRIFINVEKLDN
jgi:hypothetical protein